MTLLIQYQRLVKCTSVFGNIILYLPTIISQRNKLEHKQIWYLEHILRNTSLILLNYKVFLVIRWGKKEFLSHYSFLLTENLKKGVTEKSRYRLNAYNFLFLMKQPKVL